MELYYYTTTETLRFILEKGDIFATNIRYMNDSEEYINGVNELWKLIQNQTLVEKWLKKQKRNNLTYEKLKSLFTKEILDDNERDAEFYSISFCQENDLLSQWAIYARESGVSIKMNFERDSYCFSTKSIEETEKDAQARWKTWPQEVFYFTHEVMQKDSQEYEDCAYNILDRLSQQGGEDFEDNINEIWKYISTYIKRYDFHQEAESRLIFQPRKSTYQPQIQYRCDRKVLKPYLDICCESGWPIWEIMIGPGFNQKVVYDSVIHFLNHTTVKNGVDSARDYAQRVKSYFDPYMQEIIKIAENFIPPLDSSAIDKMELSMFRLQLYDRVYKICDYIRKNESCEELQKYVRENSFTESGIVVSKSSIPYLF